MKKSLWLSLSLLAAVLFFSCNNNQPATENKETVNNTPKIREEPVSYTGDNVTMNGFIAYDENKTGPRNVVMIIPEWWGLNDYVKGRAKQLAELGYFAMAVDMYGNGKIADNPDSAMKFAGPFYNNPTMMKTRYDAALAKALSYAQADSGNVAAIGYCFGGAQVLNLARMGENLKGVVSFHGNLVGVPANKQLLKAKVLACHGAADQFVKQEEVDKFKKQMDSIGADYSLKIYPNATHAFTNPNATAVGEKFKLPIAYNAAADTASWKDMREFFDSIFKH